MDCSYICSLDEYLVFNFIKIVITVSHKRCTPTKPQSPQKMVLRTALLAAVLAVINLKIAIKSKAKTQKEPVQ